MSDFFADIPKITYQGPDAETRLAYRYYDKNKKVLGKTMEEHLRMAICYWHTFCWDGFDIFGAGSFDRPWHKVTDSKEAADAKLDAAFAFFTRMDLPYFCFHDVDVMAPMETPKEHVAELARMVDQIEKRIDQTGVKLLWGTANLFSHPRFMSGGATNPDADVVAFAGLQVRECLNATHRLGGSNYVLWGGREGYDTLLNTNLRQERDQFGRFLSMVVEHKHKIGFKGDILIEPKPHEPTKNQYDRDVATVHGMLVEFGLEKEVNVNIEPNHATLAGHSFEHEVEMANALGVFGSIDINRGDPQNGWDTDQFAYDLREVTLVMYYILKSGGFKNGGFNFDAKVRRQSRDAEDLFHGHVGGADLLARALLGTAEMIENDQLQAFKDARYIGWDTGHGKDMLAGKLTLDHLADTALDNNLTPEPTSGRQEMLENIVNDATK